MSATAQSLMILEKALTERIGTSRFQLWFAGHAHFKWSGQTLSIIVPNAHYEEWLQKTFGDAIRQTARDVFGQEAKLRFLVDPESAPPDGPAQAGDTSTPATPPRVKEPKEETPQSAQPSPQKAGPSRPLDRVRRWRQLSDFVVGPCNRLAFASAQSVVEEPGEAVNPLVIHGPVGTGKTHLLEGIYLGLRRAFPDWRVSFLTSEDFTNRFVQAMRFEKLASFRRSFRECDALLIDDLQFLARKKATQEEFLHTFDVLHASGRQLVLTCDCHPRLADDFSVELADRLLGGAVWGLLPPDADTRLAILRARAGKSKPLIREDVLRFLAEQLRGNVRELEGALNSLRHYSRVTKRRIDIMLVREALAELLHHSIRSLGIADVENAICQVLQLSGGALRSRDRAWAVSHPRMLAMYLARKHTGASYTEIGKYFGGRNHSTVVAAEKRARKWLDEEAELQLGKLRRAVREVMDRVEQVLLH